MARLFVASFLKKNQLESITRFQEENFQHLEKQLNKPLRKVKAESLHLTWLFLGEVQTVQIETLKETLSKTLEKGAAYHRELNLTYDQFEIWPDYKRPRVGVARASVVPNTIFEIRNSINSQLKEFCSKDSKKFKPHLTVYRIRERKFSSNKTATNPIKIKEEWTPLVHQLETIDLVESDLSQGAPVYKSLLSIPLKSS